MRPPELEPGGVESVDTRLCAHPTPTPIPTHPPAHPPPTSSCSVRGGKLPCRGALEAERALARAMAHFSAGQITTIQRVFEVLNATSVALLVPTMLFHVFGKRRRRFPGRLLM